MDPIPFDGNDGGMPRKRRPEEVNRTLPRRSIPEASTGLAFEQRDGIGQVNQAVANLDQMTQQNAALVEESSAAAAALHEQAQRLAQVVAVFNVGNGAVAAPRSPARVAPPAVAPAPVKTPAATPARAPQAKPTPTKAAAKVSAPQIAPAKTPAALDADGEWESF